MGNGSIIGPRMKIWRAAEHKAALEDAIDEWTYGQPFQIIGNRNPVTGWFETQITDLVQPPLRLGAIFGDFVYNLESALDLLVAQLVIASGNVPSTGNYIPVVTDELKWPRVLTDKLKGVRSDLADRLKRHQPFTESDHPERHRLCVLHSANRINKHTLITPTTISQFEVEPTYLLNRKAEPGDHVVQGLVPPPVGAVVVNDQVIMSRRAVSPRGDLRITGLAPIPIPATIGVGFDLPIKVPGRFPNLIEFVIGVVDEFEDVLGV